MDAVPNKNRVSQFGPSLYLHADKTAAFWKIVSEFKKLTEQGKDLPNKKVIQFLECISKDHTYKSIYPDFFTQTEKWIDETIGWFVKEKYAFEYDITINLIFSETESEKESSIPVPAKLTHENILRDIYFDIVVNFLDFIISDEEAKKKDRKYKQAIAKTIIAHWDKLNESVVNESDKFSQTRIFVFTGFICSLLGFCMVEAEHIESDSEMGFKEYLADKVEYLIIKKDKAKNKNKK